MEKCQSLNITMSHTGIPKLSYFCLSILEIEHIKTTMLITGKNFVVPTDEFTAGTWLPSRRDSGGKKERVGGHFFDGKGQCGFRIPLCLSGQHRASPSPLIIFRFFFMPSTLHCSVSEVKSFSHLLPRIWKFLMWIYKIIRCLDVYLFILKSFNLSNDLALA